VTKLCPVTGKHCHTSKEQARKKMGRLSARLRIYQCPHCNYWHLTKSVAPDRKRKKTSAKKAGKARKRPPRRRRVVSLLPAEKKEA
jgi:hypothetical protein